MHDGCPVACLDKYPFAYVNVFTSHVNVGSSSALCWTIPPVCWKEREIHAACENKARQ